LLFTSLTKAVTKKEGAKEGTNFMEGRDENVPDLIRESAYCCQCGIYFSSTTSQTPACLRFVSGGLFSNSDDGVSPHATVCCIAAVGKQKGGPPGVQLRSSNLGTNFHYRDAIGKGLLARVHTPAGFVARVIKD
jgi:hypothetical protein